MVNGCFSEFGLRLFFPVSGHVNATACYGPLDNYMLPGLWKEFAESPFLLKQECAPAHKAKSIKAWFE